MEYVASWEVDDLWQCREVRLRHLDGKMEVIVNPAEVVANDDVLVVIAEPGAPRRRFSTRRAQGYPSMSHREL